jgi:hypothetical protein
MLGPQTVLDGDHEQAELGGPRQHVGDPEAVVAHDHPAAVDVVEDRQRPVVAGAAGEQELGPGRAPGADGERAVAREILQ